MAALAWLLAAFSVATVLVCSGLLVNVLMLHRRVTDLETRVQGQGNWLRELDTGTGELASCGHAADGDGECSCSSWPERAPEGTPKPRW